MNCSRLSIRVRDVVIWRFARFTSANHARFLKRRHRRHCLSTIPDEMLELYAFIFCQSGFRQLGMTFEQFLLVAATLKPGDLPATREEALAF